jgi:hypothetical protein
MHKLIAALINYKEVMEEDSPEYQTVEYILEEIIPPLCQEEDDNLLNLSILQGEYLLLEQELKEIKNNG